MALFRCYVTLTSIKIQGRSFPHLQLNFRSSSTQRAKAGTHSPVIDQFSPQIICSHLFLDLASPLLLLQHWRLHISWGQSREGFVPSHPFCPEERDATVWASKMRTEWIVRPTVLLNCWVFPWHSISLLSCGVNLRFSFLLIPTACSCQVGRSSVGCPQQSCCLPCGCWGHCIGNKERTAKHARTATCHSPASVFAAHALNTKA